MEIFIDYNTGEDKYAHEVKDKVEDIYIKEEAQEEVINHEILIIQATINVIQFHIIFKHCNSTFVIPGVDHVAIFAACGPGM